MPITAGSVIASVKSTSVGTRNTRKSGSTRFPRPRLPAWRRGAAPPRRRRPAVVIDPVVVVAMVVSLRGRPEREPRPVAVEGAELRFGRTAEGDGLQVVRHRDLGGDELRGAEGERGAVVRVLHAAERGVRHRRRVLPDPEAVVVGVVLVADRRAHQEGQEFAGGLLLPGCLRDPQPEVDVDAHLVVGRVVGRGERERAEVHVGVGLRDLAECPRALQVHRGLPLRERQVAVAVAPAGRTRLVPLQQLHHAADRGGEVPLERHCRPLADRGALAVECREGRRHVEHAADRVVEHALRDRPVVLVRAVHRRDAGPHEPLAHVRERAPGRRYLEALLREERLVVDHGRGGDRVGQDARAPRVVGGLLHERPEVRVDRVPLPRVRQVGQRAVLDERDHRVVVVQAPEVRRPVPHEVRGHVRRRVADDPDLRLALVELRDDVVEVPDDLGLRHVERDRLGAAARSSERGAPGECQARADAARTEQEAAAGDPGRAPGGGVCLHVVSVRPDPAALPFRSAGRRRCRLAGLNVPRKSNRASNRSRGRVGACHSAVRPPARPAPKRSWPGRSAPARSPRPRRSTLPDSPARPCSPRAPSSCGSGGSATSTTPAPPGSTARGDLRGAPSSTRPPGSSSASTRDSTG
ncbi:hypothetical protein Cus16_3014 [Curtobacterium sp. ER1/6]|nr:hypothetical protein Cus16_3014 [Curtobacterium sp. ER1/6]